MTDFLPYTRHEITAADRAAVDRVLRSPHLTQGPEVEAFEAELCAVSGAKYAVVVSSGTAALHCLYAAWAQKRGWEETWLPAISFVATANAAIAAGVQVHFTDNPPTTDIDTSDIEVSIGGDIPNRRTTPHPWIADYAHALGAVVDWNRLRAVTYSFHPAKHVAVGEGGAVCTNEEAIAFACRLFRSHGRESIRQVAFGLNYRMSELSAALGRSQLTRLAASIARRREIAAQYEAAFHPFGIQTVTHSERSVRHLYQLLVADRDGVQARLTARGIGTAIHYPPIPLQPWWRERGGYTEAQFPLAVAYAARTLSIPLFPSMRDADVARVIQAVIEAVNPRG